MKCKKCGSNFHEDHGCGMSVGCGSCYAEHIMGHDGIGFQGAIFDNVATRIKKGTYNIWEGPAGECPFCYHKKKLLNKI